MQELLSIKEISNPRNIFYVADGTLGQDAVNSALEFKQIIDSGALNELKSLACQVPHFLFHKDCRETLEAT